MKSGPGKCSSSFETVVHLCSRKYEALSPSDFSMLDNSVATGIFFAPACALGKYGSATEFALVLYTAQPRQRWQALVSMPNQGARFNRWPKKRKSSLLSSSRLSPPSLG
jgi:hypothetical protein